MTVAAASGAGRTGTARALVGLPAGRDRFVAFAFAAADLLLEAAADGQVIFATGAFPARLGRPAECFLGRPAREMVAPADRAIFDAALRRLLADGRLAPVPIRLDGGSGEPLSLTGLVHPAETGTGTRRLALCLSPLPAGGVPAQVEATPLSAAATGPSGLAQEVTELLLDTTGQRTGGLMLVELQGQDGRIAPRAPLAREIEATLAEHGGARAVATQIAPGRFGLLGRSDAVLLDVARVVERLQGVLKDAGLERAQVLTETIAIDLPEEIGLTGSQAVRALRFALGVFAQGGAEALSRTGFRDGLRGFVAEAAGRAAALRRAITERRFGIAFQPIVDLGRRDRVIVHHEALIRPLPAAGLPPLGPQDFVCLAEMLGLSIELDLAVADSALHALRRTGAATQLAVNASGLSLQDERFRTGMAELLARHPAAAANRLLLELTETAEIEDEAAAVAACDALRSAGLRICVDDFGTGAAGMRYLRAFRPDLVKLEGRFVSAATGANGAGDRAFAAALVDLARATGAEVVSERIETEAEAAAVLALGVRFGQGWLFGRPGALPGSLHAASFKAPD